MSVHYSSTVIRTALALLTLTALHACNGGPVGDGEGANDGAGTARSKLKGAVDLPGGTTTFLEAEPNDTVDQAHSIGPISAGDSLTILGHTSTLGADPFDAFRFTATERVEITATLDFDSPVANDFDMRVYDLVGMQFVESYAATSVPEVGVFHANGAFMIVIEAFSGEDTYSLHLDVVAAGNSIGEDEPNDPSGSAQYLGELNAGETIVLSGSANSGGNASDLILVACPASTSITASLAFPGGANFDVVVSNATADITNPGEVARFDSLTNNPETGTYNSPAMRLLEIEVLAVAGSGSYTLTLTGAVPLPTNDPDAGDGRNERHGRRIAPLAREAVTSKKGGTGAFFGRPALPAVPGELLVKPRPGRDLAGMLARRGCHVEGEIPDRVLRVRFEFDASVSADDRARYTTAMAASLDASDDVEYCERNLYRFATGEPNDTFYNLQWHYSLLQLPAAWDITTGDNGVIVAVIDTGETSHPDLAGRQIGGYDFISDIQNAGDGNGMDPDPTDVGDSNGLAPSSFHGTHVAGTIGANSDNGEGGAGVTWATRLMHLRVLGLLGASDMDIANAILYAAQLANGSGAIPGERADIVNLSLGGPGFSQTVQDAVTDAYNAGVVLVAAAGNNDSNVAFYPAANTNVISVSAVDLVSAKAPDSNFHSTVDLAAPGGDLGADLNGDGYPDGVLSTLVDDAGSSAEFVYQYYQGTSMAAPHVSGIAALMLAVDPLLTPAEIEAILESTATDLGPAGHDDVFGNGLVNAYQAVALAAGGAAGGPAIGLTTHTLGFGTSTTTLDVQVANIGGGLLSVASVTPTTDDGANWLTATAIPDPTPTTTDTQAVRVTVSRSGLSDGVYVGIVEVDSDGGTATIQVSMVKSSGSQAVDVDLFVLAVEYPSFTTAGQDIVNPTGSLSYEIGQLLAGDYVIIVGSDVDDDGFICDEGEPFCGLFPTLDQPLVVSVEHNETISGLDLVVSGTFTGASAGAPFGRKFQLIR